MLISPLEWSGRIGVQSMMQEMERMQARGEIPEEELKALEEDVTGSVWDPL